MTIEKSLSSYVYDKPLPTKPPQWATDRDAVTWRKGGFSAEKLPAGVYKPVSPYDGPSFLYRVKFSGDKLLALPDDPSSDILEHITDFWGKEEAFRELGVTYKRGIILYGPPGSGKSVTIFRLATMLEEHDAIMIMAQSAHSAHEGIEIVKSLEPNRKIVVIFEDIDGIINRYGDESMTHLLDGDIDVDNVLFIATTNYPRNIPPRLFNRPSRFDMRIKIGMPTEAARRFYIENIVSNLLVDIDELVSKTDGLSIAEIKEVIILVQVFENNIDEAISKMSPTLLGD